MMKWFLLETQRIIKYCGDLTIRKTKINWRHYQSQFVRRTFNFLVLRLLVS